MPATTMRPTFTQDPLGKHSAYVTELSHKYSALSKLAPEEPSPLSSPEADEDRTQWLRERVQEAWVKADGNPADGRWGVVTRLLRMGVTSGRNGRWIGARTDIKIPEKPEAGSGWLNASSEAEWNDWEKKFNQDRLLKDKVENWKRNVALHRDAYVEAESVKQVPTAIVAESTASHGVDIGNRRKPNDVSGSTIKPATVASNPFKNAAPFGFGVVKRSSQVNVLNEKAAASGKQKDSRPSQPLSGAPSNQRLPNNSSPGMQKNRASQVASNPEPSLIPPSFSDSQLLTSTPKKIAKPNPLAAQMSSSPLPPLSSSKLHVTRALLARSSSLSSPKVTKVAKSYRRVDLSQRLSRRQDESSASLPAISFSTPPMRNTTSQHSDMSSKDNLNANKKRTFAPPTSLSQGSDPDGRLVKKAKLTTSADNTRPMDIVTTPVRPRAAPGAVPTLTELLASNKKSKKKHIVSTTKPMNPGMSQKHSMQEHRGPIEIIEDGDANLGALAREQFDGDAMLYPLEDVEMVLASPAKSLSPIVVLDAEDPFVEGGNRVQRMEFDLDSSFRPLATSTQVQDRTVPSPLGPNDPIITQPDKGRPEANAADSWESIYASRPGALMPIPSSSPNDPPSASGSPFNSFQSSSFPKPSYPMYNSQFESAVGMQVDKVDKLLEKDVDYGRWLKDPYANDDGDIRSEHSIEDPSSSPGFSPGDSAAMREGPVENELSYGYGKAFECEQSF